MTPSEEFTPGTRAAHAAESQAPQAAESQARQAAESQARQAAENQAAQGSGVNADAGGMLAAARSGATRVRATPSSAEGIWVIVLGVVIAVSLAAGMLYGQDLSLRGLVLWLVLLWTVGSVINSRRGRSRTVRPRHFTIAYNLAGVWGGILGPASVSAFWFSDQDPAQLWPSLGGIAAATAPLIACGCWLIARSR